MIGSGTLTTAFMSLSPSKRDWKFAISDLANGIWAWQMWTLLGVSDIRQRYKRSRIGQFWITLSMGVFVGGIGVVYAFLFKQPVYDYIPFLAVNYVVWSLISGVIGDSTTAFVQASVFLRHEALPKTAFVMRVLMRNLIAFAHNLVIIPLVFLAFGVIPSPVALLAIPGLALLFVAAFLVTLIFGILCTRFRDLPQIVQNLVQIAFFVTPVMWHADQLGGRARLLIVELNPFTAFLQIVAEPIQSRVPGLAVYASALLAIVILVAFAWPLFARFRARIVYWL
jgi:ABC-type polysaccharide/polyol phosphate export permease